MSENSHSITLSVHTFALLSLLLALSVAGTTYMAVGNARTNEIASRDYQIEQVDKALASKEAELASMKETLEVVENRADELAVTISQRDERIARLDEFASLALANNKCWGLFESTQRPPFVP